MLFNKPRNQYSNLGIHLGIVWLFMFLYRLVFVSKNSSFFPDFGFSDFLVGSWFDLITLSFFYLPFIIVCTLPLPDFVEEYRKIGRIICYLPVTVLIFFLNAWDVAFFSFTRKRVSFNYFKFLFSENEAGGLAVDYMTEFWWLILLFILSLVFIFYLFFKSKFLKIKMKRWYSWSLFLMILFASIITGRGGFQLKPIDILEVTKYTEVKNAPAALNSAFTILKTINYNELERKKYFSNQQAKQIFNPVQVTNELGFLSPKNNVVLIIFESFGSMYVGPNNKESFTPYFDSVLIQSMYFEHAVSNGQSSMDAVPAIIASIPSWMKESFILSSYNLNQYNSLPNILGEFGYSSAFFHGTTNGSMRFDSYAAAAGFDRYYGRTEYGNDAHFDGTWGIPDHHFLPWSIDKMNGMKEPFLSTIFTYSSHHPYTIPQDFKRPLRAGVDPICESLNYADYAFKDFWEKAKRQKWFENTLFVFCADHVGPTKRKDRGNLEWSFKIPIAFYHTSGKLPVIKSNETLQQIDIMPTIIDLLGVNTSYFSVGSSYFSQNRAPNMSFYNNNIVSMGPNIKPFIWSEIKEDIPEQNRNLALKIKAIYQQYINALIDNKMIP